MITWDALRTRVYNTADLSSDRVLPARVDGWLKRGIAEISAIGDDIPTFWNALAPLEATHISYVTSVHNIYEMPPLALRIHPNIQIGGRSALLRTSGAGKPRIKDEYHQATAENPQIVTESTAQARGATYRVYPQTLAGEEARIMYLKEAQGSESFSEDASELIALQSAIIGLTELKQDTKEIEARLAQHVALLTGVRV